MKKKHAIHENAGDRTFRLISTGFLVVFMLLTLIPLLAELAASLSSKAASDMNKIGLIPVDFTFDSWSYILSRSDIWTSFLISASSTALVVVGSLIINALMAYPLSKSDFKPGKVIMLFVVFTMIFKAPTVPYYITIKDLGLIDSYWVMVIPQLLYAYNMVIMRTFFKSFPQEVEEAAEIDGCGKFRMLFSIVLPSSAAVMATVGLFYGVASWNQYQTPLMFIHKQALYPLQLKIKQLINTGGDTQAITLLPNVNYTTQTLSAATVIISMIPVLAIYPFLQKHFAKGAMLGSVKG